MHIRTACNIADAPDGLAVCTLEADSRGSRWAEGRGMEVGKEGDATYNVTPDRKAIWKEYVAKVNRAKEVEERGRDEPDPPRSKKQKQEHAEGAAEDHGGEHDTVGAVVIDSKGEVAGGVSSGGLNLNIMGRVGEAAIYGCGCWAQRGAGGAKAVATSCTGTGEEVVRRRLASECAKVISEPSGVTPHEGFRKLLGPREGEHPEWAPKKLATNGVKRL